jgi:microcystin-dependent protein
MDQSGFVNKIYNSVKIHDDIQDTWKYLRLPNIGDLKNSISNIDHQGWLKCDGRSLNRVEYRFLFEMVGTAFGNDDDETFKLPDSRGRVIGTIGAGSGLTVRTLGEVVGEENHTLTVNQLPPHSHTGTTDLNGSHTHSSNANGGQGGAGLAIADGSNTGNDVDSSPNELNLWTLPQALVINSNGAHTHTFTTNTTGSGLAFNVMQPTLFIGNVFIFAK